jgi:hypothetical protein
MRLLGLLLILFFSSSKGHTSDVKQVSCFSHQTIIGLSTESVKVIKVKHSQRKTGHFISKRKRKSRGLEQHPPIIQSPNYKLIDYSVPSTFQIYKSPLVDLTYSSLSDRGPPHAVSIA